MAKLTVLHPVAVLSSFWLLDFCCTYFGFLDKGYCLPRRTSNTLKFFFHINIFYLGWDKVRLEDTILCVAHHKK